MKENDKKFELSENETYGFFEINTTGETTGNMYMGKFKVLTVLDPEQKLAAGREYRALLGPNPAYASDLEANLAFAIAQLKYRMVEAAPFWNGGRLKDENIILEVLDKSLAVELYYRDEIKKRSENNLKKIQEHFVKMQEQAKKAKEEADKDPEDVLNEEDGDEQR